VTKPAYEAANAVDVEASSEKDEGSAAKLGWVSTEDVVNRAEKVPDEIRVDGATQRDYAAGDIDAQDASMDPTTIPRHPVKDIECSTRVISRTDERNPRMRRGKREATSRTVHFAEP
jgi:hypothetical protein